jgi:hypothetical protein
VSAESLKTLASKVGLVIPEKNIDDFRTLLAGVDEAAKLVLGEDGRFESQGVSPGATSSCSDSNVQIIFLR